jgi:hypothetical protein
VVCHAYSLSVSHLSASGILLIELFKRTCPLEQDEFKTEMQYRIQSGRSQSRNMKSSMKAMLVWICSECMSITDVKYADGERYHKNKDFTNRYNHLKKKSNSSPGNLLTCIPSEVPSSIWNIILEYISTSSQYKLNNQ